MNTEETVLYEDKGIKITNLRAVIQTKTYAMSNITSVEMATKKPSGCAPAVIALIGLVVMVGYISILSSGASSNTITGIVVGGVIMAAGIAYGVLENKSTFTIKIGSASGESNIMESGDEETVKKIVAAMNDAIIRRG